MADPVKILGADGKPLSQRRPSMVVGGKVAPYDAADIYSGHLAAWRPYLWSPDGELNMYRDRIVSRVRDLVRNDGWASGTVTRVLDNAIGADFRPISKPDYKWLQFYTGNKAFDATWADEFGRAVDAYWRNWGNDTGRYCDVTRNQTIPQMMRLAFRHKLIDGDALAIMYWLPQRVGIGKARYATAVQVVDPDRLSNPQMQFDQQTMRGGVQVDEYGVATGYWIRRAHQGDWFNAEKAMHWDLYPRETDWGRPVVVHDYDMDRAAQHRGGAGILTPVIDRLKMLIKYDGTELDAAIINAIFGAYIESPFDPQFVEQAMGESEELNTYQQARVDFHGEKRMTLGESRIPILFPGEKITAVAAERPNTNFKDFEAAVLRNIAAGSGLSAQQVSNNWSDVNYSSARAALLEAWKTLSVRRHNFGIGFSSKIRAGFLEECFDVDDLPLPRNAPDFIECREAYARCKWMGPGRGWVDPVKEKAGSILGMDAGLSTLENEAAESAGEDWEEIIDQRKREIEAFKERGMTPPSWAVAENATNSIREPEAE